MIVDKLDNWERYRGCHPNIALALQFIRDHRDDPDLKTGAHVLRPDQVIVHVVDKETQARENLKMELHKNFMDIHYILSGAERCGVGPLPGQVDYDKDTDNGFWDCADDYAVQVGEGEFYAVWPMEPHCPLCALGGRPGPVRKFICKVKVD